MPLFRNQKPVPPAPAAPAAQTAADPPPLPVLPFHGDETALWFRDELAAGRWREFRDFLEATPDSGLRGFYLGVLPTKGAERPAWLDEWVAAEPDSSLALLVRGWHGVEWAWAARGGGRARTVKMDAWPVFRARLKEADQDLAKAADLDETDPLPTARSINAAMGLGLGQKEVRYRFDEADRREPLNGPACVAMIEATARKWGGSHKAMFRFAREMMERAPEGHSVHKTVALAHIEQWIDLDRDQQARYFFDDSVKLQILSAAEHSIRSPHYDHAGSVLQYPDRAAFAFCFARMHDYDAQLEQMEIMGERFAVVGWKYKSKNPARAYETDRQRALRRIAERDAQAPSETSL